MEFLKITLILTFFYLTFQDIKDRQVDWYLILLVGIFCGVLHYSSVLSILFWMSLLQNLIVVGFVILGLALYVLFRKGLHFKNVIGLGDILLFIALSASFSSISFLVLFVASLLFSLITHLLFKQKLKYKTVPLAGHMSLFFAISYLGFWMGFTNILYSI